MESFNIQSIIRCHVIRLPFILFLVLVHLFSGLQWRIFFFFFHINILTSSSFLNSWCLTSKFSTIASTTRSALLLALTGSVAVLILAIDSVTNFSASWGLSLYIFLATLPKLLLIDFCDFDKTSEFTSTRITFWPAWADT